jgi:hypothetical protein
MKEHVMSYIQISHVNNAAKDSEMVAMKKSWIYRAIFENRKEMLMNSSDLLDTYRKEFDQYFLWVRGKEVTGCESATVS